MKDNRTILRAPRIHGRLVKDEDEIAAALSPEQGAKLIQSGALIGSDWEFTGNGGEPESPDEVSAAEVAASYISGTFGVERDSDDTAEEFVEGVIYQLRALHTKNANVKRELQEAGDNSQAALRKAQVELDNEKAEVFRLTSENETLKADAEKAKPKPPAK